MGASSTVVPHQGPSSASIVLLRDGGWPQLSGVCCWRQGFRAAFDAAGAQVEEMTWQPPEPRSPQRPPSRRTEPRAAWLPGVVRRPLAKLYRGARAAQRSLAARRWPRNGAAPARRRPQLPPELRDATLVVAESIEVATAVIATGMPRSRVWALVLPPERLHSGERNGFAVSVARAAEKLGGLLTDSEPARDSLERAATTVRPRVEIFPPLAVDRHCPEHHPEAEPPDPVHPAAAQLAVWRTILDGAGDPGAQARCSFAAARLRGTLGQWAAPPHQDWHREPGRWPAPSNEPGPAHWTSDAQVEAARRIWHSVVPHAPRRPRTPRAALVAGFDLKFARDLAARLGNRTDLEMVVDEWRALSRGTDHTAARLRDADSIFAEWARTSAIWYSRQKRPDQFLAVRLHRFELDSPYPHDIAIENVDAVVYIAPLFGRRIRAELDWPAEKLVYIPNFLDLDWLDRPKLPEARFAIGFVGIEWRRKRFDLALDLLSALRREDPRFTLVVRSTMPWQNKYAWTDPGEREYVGQCFERIERDPWLRHAVRFDEPGRDMARWFRRIGYILSTSDEEGCHTAVGEGMASAAVPIVRPWPGADEIYDKEWTHAHVEDAAAVVLAGRDAGAWQERGARARAEIRQSHDPVAVVDAWADLLHGDVAGARGYFAAYSDLSVGATSGPAASAPGPQRSAGPAGGADGPDQAISSDMAG